MTYNAHSIEIALTEIAREVNSLHLAYSGKVTKFVQLWHEEHVREEAERASFWAKVKDPANWSNPEPSPEPPPVRELCLFPLPQRNLSLAEKVACLVAIHEALWKGDLIHPFPKSRRSRIPGNINYEIPYHCFLELEDGVWNIPDSDLWFLHQFLNELKNEIIPGRDKEFYPHRNDLWCRWFEREKSTDAEIRDRWNRMSDEERKAVDSRGWQQIDAGPKGADHVKKTRSKRGIKR